MHKAQASKYPVPCGKPVLHHVGNPVPCGKPVLNHVGNPVPWGKPVPNHVGNPVPCGKPVPNHVVNPMGSQMRNSDKPLAMCVDQPRELQCGQKSGNFGPGQSNHNPVGIRKGSSKLCAENIPSQSVDSPVCIQCQSADSPASSASPLFYKNIVLVWKQGSVEDSANPVPKLGVEAAQHITCTHASLQCHPMHPSSSPLFLQLLLLLALACLQGFKNYTSNCSAPSNCSAQCAGAATLISSRAGPSSCAGSPLWTGALHSCTLPGLPVPLPGGLHTCSH